MFSSLRSGTDRTTLFHRSRSVFQTVVVVVAASALMIASPAEAQPGGTSAAAELCQQGGYENFVTVTGQNFANAGECVSYAARGGSLQPRARTAQQICEAAGGIFTEGSLEGAFRTWRCAEGLSEFDQATIDALDLACSAYGDEWQLSPDLVCDPF